MICYWLCYWLEWDILSSNTRQDEDYCPANLQSNVFTVDLRTQLQNTLFWSARSQTTSFYETFVCCRLGLPLYGELARQFQMWTLQMVVRYHNS